jgi:DNA invertase Pin-like site-specific DNA recombinase
VRSVGLAQICDYNLLRCSRLKAKGTSIDTLTMPETLYCYARVSSSAQEVEGTSLNTQVEMARRKAEELGFELKIFDEGAQSSSNDSITTRPKLMALLEEVDSGRCKHLFVYNTDRLSRNEQTWATIRFKLQKADVTLHISSGTYTLSSPTDKLLLYVMEAISEYDNTIRKQRSVLGKTQTVKAGFWLGGPPPFGYKIVDKKLEIEDSEAKWVRFIFESYRDKKTPRWIRDQLFLNGVKTRREKLRWSLGSIEALLTNTHYGGFYYVTFSNSKERHRVACPQILDGALLLSVASERERRTRQNKVKNATQKNFYQLKGLLTCGACGATLSGRIFPSQYRSVYYCPRKERAYAASNPTGEQCTNRRYLKIEETDDLVWDSVISVLGRSHRFKEEVKRQVFPDGHAPSTMDEIAKLKRAKKKISDELSEVTNSLITIETDKILKRRSADEIERIIASVEHYRLELQSRQEEFDSQISSLQSRTQWINWLQKFSEKVSKFSEFNPQERRDFLHGVLKRIVVITEDKQTHRLRLEFSVPYVDDSLTWLKERGGKKRYEINDGESVAEVELPSKKSQSSPT